MTIDEIETGLRVESRGDGRSFIVAGDHWIPRKFIWSIRVDSSMARTWDLIVSGIGGEIEIIYLPATQENRKRLEALRDRIIELWVVE